MKYVIINPTECKVEVVDTKTIHEAYKLAGLKPDGIDHGTVVHGEEWSVSIVVYEFGLFLPPEQGRYFCIGHNLFEGSAVLYAYNEAGETIDMPMDPPPVMFFKSHREVEAAIQRGEVRRPETAINDQVIWRWPEKRGAQIMEHATNVRQKR